LAANLNWKKFDGECEMLRAVQNKLRLNRSKSLQSQRATFLSDHHEQDHHHHPTGAGDVVV
jgi:hypothetical protein